MNGGRCDHHEQPLHAQAFEKASGKKVNTKLVGRRPGDAEAVWAATDTAENVLGWKSKLGVKEMCEDQWLWASKYPKVSPMCRTRSAHLIMIVAHYAFFSHDQHMSLRLCCALSLQGFET